jgi:zinc transporter 9
MALVGNGVLTVLKFATFMVSGSGAMLSEAVHSLADTANQGLLYIGIRRSERPADAMFHYGFGGERFFYSLMSAVGIFVLGCGVTAYHGIHTLLHPPELSFGWSTWVVLAISFVVDGVVLRKAIQAVDEMRGEESFLTFVRTSSDPTVAAVLLEDGVACLGVLVAMTGILLSMLTGSPVFDSLATLAIAGMMGFVAIWLGYKNRILILGPAIPATVQESAVRFLEDQPTVDRVRHVQSRVVGAGTFRLKAEVDWSGRVLAEREEAWALTRLAEAGSDAESQRAVLREFGERITDAVGDEIDRIEEELNRRHPELSYLDLESD